MNITLLNMCYVAGYTFIWVETVLLLLCLILRAACIHRSDIRSTLDRMKFTAGPLLLLRTSCSGLRVVRISACVQPECETVRLFEVCTCDSNDSRVVF